MSRGPFRPRLPLILASTSPRRQAMLASLGLWFHICPPEVDEHRLPYTTPRDHALKLAQAKARACQEKGAVIIGADTVVAQGEHILGKPADTAEALTMLRLLAGSEHAVHTGVCIRRGTEEHAFVVSARVRMAAVPDSILAAYASTGEGLDKAGGYALQGIGGFLVETVSGSVSAVIGLPLAETVSALLAMEAIEVTS
jgi:septum formation protein